MYTVHEGRLLVVYGDHRVRKLITLTADDEPVYIARAGERHSVYQFPGTVFTTQTLGTPVGNPERKDNDWYPAESGFAQEAHAGFAGTLLVQYGIKLHE